MSNYTQLGFVKQTDGENEGSWGDVLNENLIDLLDDAIGGYVEVSVASGNVTLAFADGTADNNGRHAVIKFTGSPGTTRTVTFPDAQINYFIINGSDGSVICTSGTGAATVTIPTGMKDIIYVDGSDEVLSMLATPHISGNVTIGVDDTGYDVKFFGATSGSYMLWDESADSLLLTDSTPLKIGDSQDLTLYHDGSNSYITNAVGALKIATETSGIAVTIGHTTSEVTIADNLTVTGTVTLADGSLALADLDIDGGTDIGAAIVDADLFIIDDGAGGTNRKVTASRIKTYAGGAVTAINNATANELVTIGSTTTELDAESGLTYTDGALVIGGTTPSLTIGDAGAEDTKIVFDGNAQDFHIGLDDSADDLVIGLGSSLGTTSHIVCDEAGHVTKPLQPAFFANTINSSAQSITNGSLTTINVDNEVYDVNADFNTGTYTFTAPVTGKYQISGHFATDLGTGSGTQLNQVGMQLTSSNRNYRFFPGTGWTDNYDRVAAYGSVLIDMDANDTVVLQGYCERASGGGASTSLVGSQYFSWMGGNLVC